MLNYAEKTTMKLVGGHQMNFSLIRIFKNSAEIGRKKYIEF
jgi:hypothetical protein